MCCGPPRRSRCAAAGPAASSVATCVWHSCRSGVLLVCGGRPKTLEVRAGSTSCNPQHCDAAGPVSMVVAAEGRLLSLPSHTRATHHHMTSPFTPLPRVAGRVHRNGVLVQHQVRLHPLFIPLSTLHCTFPHDCAARVHRNGVLVQHQVCCGTAAGGLAAGGCEC